MNRHSSFLFTFCIHFPLYFATILNHAFALKSCHFPTVFNLGAFTSDTEDFAATFTQPKSPNGDTFFRMPVGRLSYGRLIIGFTSTFPECPYLSACGFQFREKDSASCAKPYNGLAQHFNTKLKKTLAQLRNELPQATIVYVDIYSALYSLYTSTAKYGFQVPLVACCGYGGAYNYSDAAQCGRTLNVNGTYIMVGSCKDPSVRVNWDGTHFTEAANKFALDRVSTGAFSDPPIPLKLACHHQ